MIRHRVKVCRCVWSVSGWVGGRCEAVEMLLPILSLPIYPYNYSYLIHPGLASVTTHLWGVQEQCCGNVL